MSKWVIRLGVCLLMMALQEGLCFTASAAPIYDDRQQTVQPALTVQEQELLERKQQEIRRHEQAMLQRGDESVSDWEWRQYQEREQHILNMQQIQDDGMKVVGTPVNW